MSEKSKKNSGSSKELTQLSLAISSEERTAPMPETKEKDFEEALADLEKIVAQLEGEVKLEEALGLFDSGMKLSQHCEEFLKSAEQKIEILKRAASGKLSTEKFDEEALQINN